MTQQNFLRWQHILFAILPITFLSLMIIFPMWSVTKWVSQDFFQAFWQILIEPYYQQRFWFSFVAALSTVVVSLLFGIPLAFMVAYHRFKGREFFLRLLMLPLALPTLIVAMAFLALFGGNQGFGLNAQGTLWLVLIANLFYNETIVLRFVYHALSRLDPHWRSAAQTLGSSNVRIFMRIVLPYLWPSIIASSILVFLYSFLSFGISLLLGGTQYSTVEVEIYHLALQRLQLTEASVLILLQMSLGVVVVLFEVFWVARKHLPLFKLPQIQPQRALQPWQYIWVYAHVIFLLLPIAYIVFKSVWINGEWTLIAYEQLFLSTQTGLTSIYAAISNTLLLALCGTLGSFVVGLSQALWTWQAKSALSRICLNLPLFISPVGLAVGYLIAYPTWSVSVYLLMAVYILAGYPLFARSVLLGLESLPVSYLNTAATLGSSLYARFKNIMLPLLKPSLKTGLLLALVSALGEFTATVVLVRPEWATLTVAIYERLGYPGELVYAQAMGLATLLLCLTLLCFSAMEQSHV